MRRALTENKSELKICESLLLALHDQESIPEREILGVLRDAAAADEGLGETVGDADLHAAVAALIDHILVGGNSVRCRRYPLSAHQACGGCALAARISGRRK